MTHTPESPRCGFVAVIGAPNAGKSSLVNALVGSKVSIVTQKVQTTRFNIRGIAMSGTTQMVLIDTPGIFSPRKRLERAMVKQAWDGQDGADAVIFLIDAAAQWAVDRSQIAPDLPGEAASGADKRVAQDVQSIVDQLKGSQRQVILVLNKIDLLPREHLLALTTRLFDEGVFERVFMISAKTGSGLEDLRSELVLRMPEGPWHYEADQAADMPARMLAAEITREKLFLRVHEELPYAAAVATTDYKLLKDGSARIEQTIFVEREGQRAIVLGKDGQTLKWIGQKARTELKEIIGMDVHLFLTVKVNEKWTEDRLLYAQFGLDFQA